MADWFEHPSYLSARNKVVDKFRGHHHNFRRLQHIMFLCGGAGSPNRERLRQYIQRNLPDILCFYAESAWIHLAQTPGINALHMESRFAALADVIVIIVESPGTFAELGAFAHSDQLRLKVLPILDARYASHPSFINTGPVRWVDADSKFKPSVQVDFNVFLDCVRPLMERLRQLPRISKAKVDNISASPKHFLFFVCDLVAVIGPAPQAQIEKYVAIVLGSLPDGLAYYLGLAIAMGLISAVEVGGAHYYVPVIEHGSRPFIRRRFFDISAERARHISVLQGIDSAQDVLRCL